MPDSFTGGYRLHSLFQENVSICHGVWLGLQDAITLFNFKTRAITDHFSQLTIRHERRKTRVGLRVALLYLLAIFVLQQCQNSHDTGLQLRFSIFAAWTLMGYLLMNRCTNRLYALLTGLLAFAPFVLLFVHVPNDRDQGRNFYDLVLLHLLVFTILFTPTRARWCLIYATTLIAIHEIHVFSEYVTTPTGATATGDSTQKCRSPGAEESTLTFRIRVLMITFIIIFYNKIWLELRLRAAFIRLLQSLTARSRLREALREQQRWIRVVMPIQVSSDYLRVKAIKNGQTIYCRSCDGVSILFADIVGFTAFSSERSATEIVQLLNHLFSRFDDICQATGCEKIGTLGDCYYCVSGLLEPRHNSAACCLDMGIGLCGVMKAYHEVIAREQKSGEEEMSTSVVVSARREETSQPAEAVRRQSKQLNGRFTGRQSRSIVGPSGFENESQIDIRVGVHTGRVNAAILGNQRFRFDIYSNDVLLANLMEQTGTPGRGRQLCSEGPEAILHFIN